MAAIPLKHEDVYYPDSDGKPFAETGLHFEVMGNLINGLMSRYSSVQDVHVGGGMLFYDVEGDPSSFFSPDVFVVKGISKELRRVYKVWEEGRFPCFIIELTSDETRHEDTSSKKDRCERLGCEEYFLFDPWGDYLDPRLQGYRLEDGRYQPLAANPDGSLFSRTTGLILRVEGYKLRLIEAATGEKILWAEEIMPYLEQLEKRIAEDEERAARNARARLAAEERAARDAEARLAAEEEIVRLRRELEERNRS